MSANTCPQQRTYTNASVILHKPQRLVLVPFNSPAAEVNETKYPITAYGTSELARKSTRSCHGVVAEDGLGCVVVWNPSLSQRPATMSEENG